MELDVTLGFNPSNATPRKGSIVFIDAHSLVVCSPSFISDPRGIWYFDDDEVRFFIMDKLDVAAVSALVECRLKEYQFRPTEAEPYGNEDDFHEVTKDWLFDTDWEDEH